MVQLEVQLRRNTEREQDLHTNSSLSVQEYNIERCIMLQSLWVIALSFSRVNLLGWGWEPDRM